VLRRRREYYIGERSRRGPSRLALVLLAVVAIAGATAFASFAPAIGVSLTGSTPTSPLPTDDLLGAGTTAAPTGAFLQTPAPSIGPLPPTTPAVSTPLPCRPPEHFDPALVVSHGNVHQKTVALTFDDGTNPENTEQILRILKRFKVNATFFPTGLSMERFSDVWKAVAKANYPIANHTYGHPELAGKCYEPQRRELARAAAVFESLGIPELPVMRPPYELWDDTTSVASSAVGLQAIILWNIDTRDWQGASTATIRASALRGGRGSIILLHTFPEATAAALPGIIKGYRARGFEFVTIGQMLGIAGAVPYPPKD